MVAYSKSQFVTQNDSMKRIISILLLMLFIYSYKRGQSSLLEILNAQREENGIYLADFDTLTESAKALVALEQAAGIWDLNF